MAEPSAVEVPIIVEDSGPTLNSVSDFLALLSHRGPSEQTYRTIHKLYSLMLSYLEESDTNYNPLFDGISTPETTKAALYWVDLNFAPSLNTLEPERRQKIFESAVPTAFGKIFSRFLTLFLASWVYLSLQLPPKRKVTESFCKIKQHRVFTSDAEVVFKIFDSDSRPYFGPIFKQFFLSTGFPPFGRHFYKFFWFDQSPSSLDITFQPNPAASPMVSLACKELLDLHLNPKVEFVALILEILEEATPAERYHFGSGPSALLSRKIGDLEQSIAVLMRRENTTAVNLSGPAASAYPQASSGKSPALSAASHRTGSPTSPIPRASKAMDAYENFQSEVPEPVPSPTNSRLLSQRDDFAGFADQTAKQTGGSSPIPPPRPRPKATNDAVEDGSWHAPETTAEQPSTVPLTALTMNKQMSRIAPNMRNRQRISDDRARFGLDSAPQARSIAAIPVSAVAIPVERQPRSTPSAVIPPRLHGQEMLPVSAVAIPVKQPTRSRSRSTLFTAQKRREHMESQAPDAIDEDAEAAELIFAVAYDRFELSDRFKVDQKLVRKLRLTDRKVLPEPARRSKRKITEIEDSPPQEQLQQKQRRTRVIPRAGREVVILDDEDVDEEPDDPGLGAGLPGDEVPKDTETIGWVEGVPYWVEKKDAYLQEFSKLRASDTFALLESRRLLEAPFLVEQLVAAQELADSVATSSRKGVGDYIDRYVSSAVEKREKEMYSDPSKFGISKKWVRRRQAHEAEEAAKRDAKRYKGFAHRMKGASEYKRPHEHKK